MTRKKTKVKRVTVPLHYQPPGGRPREELSYISPDERRWLLANTDGKANMTAQKLLTYYMEGSGSGDWRDSHPGDTTTGGGVKDTGGGGSPGSSHDIGGVGNQNAGGSSASSTSGGGLSHDPGDHGFGGATGGPGSPGGGVKDTGGVRDGGFRTGGTGQQMGFGSGGGGPPPGSPPPHDGGMRTNGQGQMPQTNPSGQTSISPDANQAINAAATAIAGHLAMMGAWNDPIPPMGPPPDDNMAPDDASYYNEINNPRNRFSSRLGAPSRNVYRDIVGGATGQAAIDAQGMNTVENYDPGVLNYYAEKAGMYGPHIPHTREGPYSASARGGPISNPNLSNLHTPGGVMSSPEGYGYDKTHYQSEREAFNNDAFPTDPASYFSGQPVAGVDYSGTILSDPDLDFNRKMAEPLSSPGNIRNRALAAGYDPLSNPANVPPAVSQVARITTPFSHSFGAADNTTLNNIVAGTDPTNFGPLGGIPTKPEQGAYGTLMDNTYENPIAGVNPLTGKYISDHVPDPSYFGDRPYPGSAPPARTAMRGPPGTPPDLASGYPEQVTGVDPVDPVYDVNPDDPRNARMDFPARGAGYTVNYPTTGQYAGNRAFTNPSMGAPTPGGLPNTNIADVPNWEGPPIGPPGSGPRVPTGAGPSISPSQDRIYNPPQSKRPVSPSQDTTGVPPPKPGDKLRGWASGLPMRVWQHLPGVRQYNWLTGNTGNVPPSQGVDWGPGGVYRGGPTHPGESNAYSDRYSPRYGGYVSSMMGYGGKKPPPPPSGYVPFNPWRYPLYSQMWAFDPDMFGKVYYA